MRSEIVAVIAGLIVLSGIVFVTDLRQPKTAGQKALNSQASSPIALRGEEKSTESSPNSGQSIYPSNQETLAMKAIITTTLGSMTVELYPKEAPKTVENWQKLATKGYYDGIIFHRVIPDFMIQGGDPTGTGTGGESIFGARFADEINSHKMEEGSLAMANAGPNTNGSQFFIVTTKNSLAYLQDKHTVFGKVIEGLDVAYKISMAETDANNRPKTEIKITGIKIVKN